MISPRDVPLMLFAAGLGTRMGALTQTRPKPLIPVKGRALIDHALDIVDAFGPKTCVINTHYLAPLLEAHLAERTVTLVHETTLLETGGGIVNAMDQLGGSPIVTFNSDAIWRGPNPLRAVADAWDEDETDALLLCIPTDRAIGHRGKGDFSIDQAGQISRQGDFVYTGVQIIKTAPILAIQETKFSLNRVWDTLIPQGRAKAVVYDGQWVDVGTPEGIDLAETLLDKGGANGSAG